VPELSTYRRKRHAERTPEPVPPPGPLPSGNDDTFVIQEHHARRLHWDFRLERGGVLVSWAVPRGLPQSPKINHLAVHTEDHPIDYGSFEGDIPAGEYGGGKVILWDRGTYETEKWSDREVKVVLHGSRVSGRYVLFQTRDRDWMVHRMDPPADPTWERLPDHVDPMFPVKRSRLPARTGTVWSIEFAWGGLRVAAYVDGGILRLVAIDGEDVTRRFPEIRPLGPALGARPALLDGELVTLNRENHPDPTRLSHRFDTTSESVLRRLSRDEPAILVLYDLLHLDGHPTVDLPYTKRRALLESLALNGPSWQTAPTFPATEADAVRTTARAQNLPAVIAKRRTSPYHPGRHPDWISVAL
jgi:bifunctional non-homologous end joining protein LigD